MPAIWTAERNQRLLILLVDSIAKVDTTLLAKNYKEKFSSQDNYEPTPRAIAEHISGLKKSNGGSGKTSFSGASTSKTSTPRKPALTPSKKNGLAAKTPTSSAKTTSSKRKRTTMSEESEEDLPADDEDDSAAERAMLKTSPTPAAKRSAYSRRSKSVGKSYADGESSGESEVEVKSEKADGNNGAGVKQAGEVNGLDGWSFFDGAADVEEVGKGVGSIAVRKNGGALRGRSVGVDNGAESDVSTFSAGFHQF